MSRSSRSRSSREVLTGVVLVLSVASCSDGPHSQSSPSRLAHDSGAETPRARSGTDLELSVGQIRGTVLGTTREFLGIPYGKAPVGQRRFAPPEAATPWSGVRDATQFGASCPQPSNSSVSGPTDEDCLYLNVYTPEAVEEGPLPVMVFLYGGGFNVGSSTGLDGRPLSEAGPVVVVTLNYRVNAFGFLSHPALDAARNGSSSGSDGIRDQQLALRWVQDHIASFNGDPANVTLFGESAGSRSACVHLAAPDSRALASRFILESGACLSGGPTGLTSKSEANDRGDALVKDLCPDATGPDDIVTCLRRLPVATLADWHSTMTLIGAMWDAVAGDGPGGVLPEPVDGLLAAPNFEPRPVMLGTNRNEWATFQLLGGRVISTVDAFETALRAHFGARSAEVEARYHPDSDAVANDVYVRMLTDAAMRCPTGAIARRLADRGGDVYVYEFEQGRAIHGQELDYVFGTEVFVGLDPISAPLGDAIQSYWTTFAAKGNPTADASGAPEWPRYRSGDERYLRLVDPPRAATRPFPEVCAFWDTLAREGGVDVASIFAHSTSSNDGE